MNDKPFSYVSRNGTRFFCKRCDFRDEILYHSNHELGLGETMVNVAEMIGYHATVIHPGLNGFQGYDCVRFRYVEYAKMQQYLFDNGMLN
jgi:hypothetical protein